MALTFIERPSPNTGPRNEVDGNCGVRHLIIHYTGMETCRQALDRLCDQNAKVSAHYLIAENGDAYQLVSEDMRAWHAGVSYWRGVRDINSTSIGIEMVNPGHEWGYRPFPEPQLATFISLAQDILGRHGIAPENILGHSDIAPGRKTDPGELFPWERMAAAGIGRWPKMVSTSNVEPDQKEAETMLSQIGYAVPASQELGADILSADTGWPDLIGAFQRRYRQNRVDGDLDPETFNIIKEVSDFSKPA